MNQLKMTPNFLPLEKVEFTEEQLIEMYNLVFKSPKSNGFMKTEMKYLLFDEGYWFIELRQDNWEENLKNKLIEFGVTFNQNKMETQSIKQEQKEMNFKLNAQLLINQFYELETDGKKMDYDTAVECAKIASKTILESGDLCLNEGILFWNCILKHCDLLHSQEYLLSSLKREEKSCNPDLKESSSFAVPADKVISIGSDEEKCQSNPKKNNWYLCRLKEGDIKLCFWNGTHWENYTKKEHDSFPRVVKWFEIEDLKKLIFLL